MTAIGQKQKFRYVRDRTYRKHLESRSMLRTISLAVFLLLLQFSSAVFAVDFSQPCTEPVHSWLCVGVVEMRIHEQTNRMSFFKNHEMLAEIEASGIRKRLLVTQPSGTELYFGLSPAELSSPAKNPFMFFDQGFALPIEALRMAFPDGPFSVPESGAKRNVIVGNQPMTVMASRLSSGRISFRVDIATVGQIQGEFSAIPLEPLDGSYPLNQWERTSGPHVSNLRGGTMNGARLVS